MKVLTIDDSRIALIQIEKIVREASSQDTIVIKTQDPEEGVRLALENKDDLSFILVDLNMDKLSGLDVIDKIIPEISPERIALLTANTQNSTKDEAMKRGVHFLSKESLKDGLKDILSGLLKVE
ncbi:MAG: response regulator [Deltaproteobacteria bacterium]|nr:response regulator [Deltaproteobacteria bacterium]